MARCWTITDHRELIHPETWGHAVAALTPPKAAIWQQEECPTTGKLHIQAYVQFSNSTSLSSIQRRWPGCHAEKSRGTAEQNERYCSKHETYVAGPWKFGTLSFQGRENSDIIHDIASGTKRAREILTEEPVFYFHHRNKILDMQADTRMAEEIKRGFIKPEVYIRWGKTGTGKSRWADDNWGFCNYAQVPNGKWWDDCDHENLVFNENITTKSIEDMLLITDGRPVMMERKGGSVCVRARRILITSNIDPIRWWTTATKDQYDAFMRRVTEVTRTSVEIHRSV